MTDISVVIVNWNTADLLCRCIRSVQETVKKYSYEIIVVDNCSGDHSRDLLTGPAGEGITVILNEKNEGFAKANNQAIQVSVGRYVLLLNPDTLALPDALDSMVDYMEKNPKSGVAGPKLLNGDMTIQPSTAGRFPTLPVLICEAFGLYKLSSLVGIFRGLYLRSIPPAAGPMEVDWVCGACMLIRRSLIERVGMLNEDFFMYNEDQEFCFRSKIGKAAVCFLPGSEIIHYGNQSVLQLDDPSILSNRLKYRDYLKRYNKGWRADAAYFVNLAGLYLRALFAFLRDSKEGRKRVKFAITIGKN